MSKQKWRKGQCPFHLKTCCHRLSWTVLFSLWKMVDNRCDHNLNRTFFIVSPFQEKHCLALNGDSFYVGVNINFMRIQSNRNVFLLIVDVRLSIGKTWVKVVVYRSNQRRWSIYCHLVTCCRLFCIFLVFFLFFLAVEVSYSWFLTNFSFQPENKFQINVMARIRFKIKLSEIFLNCGGRMIFLLVGR